MKSIHVLYYFSVQIQLCMETAAPLSEFVGLNNLQYGTDIVLQVRSLPMSVALSTSWKHFCIESKISSSCIKQL